MGLKKKNDETKTTTPRKIRTSFKTKERKTSSFSWLPFLCCFLLCCCCFLSFFCCHVYHPPSILFSFLRKKDHDNSNFCNTIFSEKNFKNISHDKNHFNTLIKKYFLLPKKNEALRKKYQKVTSLWDKTMVYAKNVFICRI